MEDEALVERLLYAGEGNALDFKLQQYEFEGADEEQKSEFLKDILAFANAWRDSPAYIVVGVRDGSREIVGLDKDIDESRLQQIINSKVNRPIQFGYRSIDFKGKILGLYTIAIQDRPFFSKKKYGKVKDGAVYVRRGSSTAEADPDEVAKMGSANSAQLHAPKLSIKFVLLIDDAPPMESLDATVTDCVLPADGAIADYPEPSPLDGFRLPQFSENKDYYRQVGKYMRERVGRVGFKLEVANDGDAYADHVKITFHVPSVDELRLAVRSDLMRMPATSRNLVMPRSAFPETVNPKISTGMGGGVKTATFLVGKIQAGDAVLTEDLFFINPPEALTEVNIKIHSDQLKAPLELAMPVSIHVKTLRLTMQHIKEFVAQQDGDDVPLTHVVRAGRQ